MTPLSAVDLLRNILHSSCKVYLGLLEISLKHTKLIQVFKETCCDENQRFLRVFLFSALLPTLEFKALNVYLWWQPLNGISHRHVPDILKMCKI
ncbi:CLUMA_CG007391, isoform A [Clunio marinus]|uniref:CLUMA_CG007391, isoform A n=1 Tax=Clunio marinus TaxID=568069 RepID=A0A1J1I0K3_9DIPT|nr:CLUMA_CG007391, isoform A [Clunio marinus]